MSNIMSKYLVHFSLCLLLKGDFSQGDFSLIYGLTMGSGPLGGVARWVGWPVGWGGPLVGI